MLAKAKAKANAAKAAAVHGYQTTARPAPPEAGVVISEISADRTFQLSGLKEMARSAGNAVIQQAAEVATNVSEKADQAAGRAVEPTDERGADFVDDSIVMEEFAIAMQARFHELAEATAESEERLQEATVKIEQLRREKTAMAEQLEQQKAASHKLADATAASPLLRTTTAEFSAARTVLHQLAQSPSAPEGRPCDVAAGEVSLAAPAAVEWRVSLRFDTNASGPPRWKVGTSQVAAMALSEPGPAATPTAPPPAAVDGGGGQEATRLRRQLSEALASHRRTADELAAARVQGAAAVEAARAQASEEVGRYIAQTRAQVEELQAAGQAREDTAGAAAAAATAAAAARGEEVVACRAQLGAAKVRVGARLQDLWENTQSV